jgi:hypothetical protein
MARRPSLAVILTIVILIAIALAIKFAGPALYDTLRALHG